MARKVVSVTIDAEGRDKGKVFRITELPARKAEAWATRALLALSRAGVEVPDNIMDAGMAGIAYLDLKALGGVSYIDAQPLLAEMLECVEWQPDPSKPVFRALMTDDDIEEVATLILLRRRVLELHVDFFMVAGRLKLASRPAAASSSPTPTSPAQ